MKPFTPEEIARFRRNGATDAEIQEYQLLQSERLRGHDPSMAAAFDAAVAEEQRGRRLHELWRKLNGEADTPENP